MLRVLTPELKYSNKTKTETYEHEKSEVWGNT